MCSTVQFKIAPKFPQSQKIKNLTPSVDEECPLESLWKILWRSDGIDGALGFFQRASPPNNNNNNNNNNNKNNKISSVWGPVPGSKRQLISLNTFIKLYDIMDMMAACA